KSPLRKGNRKFKGIVGGVVASLGLVWHLFYQKEITELTLVFVVGGATTALSLLGAYGAHREKSIPLILFLAACCVACFGLLLLTVPAAIYRPQVEQEFEEKLRAAPPLYTASPDIRELAQSIQRSLKCCGLFSYTEWGPKIPDSCLCQAVDDEISGKCQDVQDRYFALPLMGFHKLIYKQTCFPILQYYMSKGFDIIFGVLFGLASLALLGVVMSAILLAQLRRSTAGVSVVFSVSSLPSKQKIWSPPPKYSELYNQPEN
uniref:Tetraspanin n=1 Tax=Esox lucius TaxID=8010 RepID=A0AAY5KWR8_ESOLU